MSGAVAISRRSWALAALIAVMIVWGSTFVVTKVAVQEIPPFTVGMLRFLVAALILAPIAIVRRRTNILPRPFPLAAVLLMALTGIAIFVVGFNYALIFGSASQGALVFALSPAAVAVAAVFVLRESAPRRRVAGIVLSIVGVAFVVATGEPDLASPDPMLGAVFMVAVVIAWAAYTVIAKRLAEVDQVVVIACVSALGAVMLLPFAIWELSANPWPNASQGAWLSVLFLGVIASALAYLVYGWTLRELDASVVGAYTNLDPIVGVLTGVLFLGETMSMGQIAGGTIALIGMWLASSEPRPSSGPQPA